MAKVARSLDSRVVAITGGARGIGRCLAEALVREGAKVSLGDIDAEMVQQTATEIGGGSLATGLDVTDPASFADYLDQTEKALGSIDVLVNNAGIMVVNPLESETDAVTRREFDINVHGVITGCKLMMTRMRSQGSGHIVNVASAAGKIGLPGEATYCATKHAVVGLSEAIRMEIADTPIEISLVMPSLANTELASGMNAGRFPPLIEPEQIAAAIVDALKFPKFDVYVPKSLGPIIKSSSIMPRRLRDAINRLFKTNEIGTSVDTKERADYIARTTAGTSDPVANGKTTGKQEKVS